MTTMPQVPADLAGTVFRLRRDAIYLKTETGIAFRSRSHVFSLNGKTIYQSFIQLLPYLDGHTDVTKLFQSVVPAACAPLTQLLKTLLDNGVIDRVDAHDANLLALNLARVFAPQIEFIAHYASTPNARFVAARASKVLLCGSGAALLAAGTALVRNGLASLAVACAPDLDLRPIQAEAARLQALGVQADVIRCAEDPTGFDLMVYCAEQPDLATLQRLNRLAMESFCGFLPGFVLAGRTLIGPIVSTSQAGCWECTLLRWADNAPARQAASVWQELAGMRTAQAVPVSQVPAQILGNNLALEVFKYLVDAAQAQSRTSLLVQDIASLVSSMKARLPHPACPACRARQGSSPVDAQDDVLAAWKPYIDEHFGKFRGFDDEMLEQLPLRLTQLRLSAAACERHGNPNFVVTGWSLSDTDAARTHALRAALALDTHDGVLLHLRSALGRPAEGAARVAPDAVVGWLGNVDPGTPCLHHLPAAALDGRAQTWLPAGAVHPCFDIEQQFDPHGAGIGVGASTGQAIEAALLSLAAHLAISGLARGELAVRTLDGWRGRCGKDADYLLTASEQFGLDPLEIGVVTLCPGLVCTILRPSGAGLSPVDEQLIGAGFSHAHAVADLLAQVVARAQLQRHGRHLDLACRAGLLAGAVIEPAWSGIERFDETNEAPGLARLGERAAAAGLQLWWLDVTPPDVASVALRVVKVVLARL